MIKHIVMWKLKDSAEGADRQENANKMKEMLEALTSKIEVIKALEVGINFNTSEAAYDVSLYTEFESVEDLNIYQKHPDHVLAAGFIGKIVEKRAVVDY